MYCGKCGTKNSDSAEFCVECGERLKPAASNKTNSNMKKPIRNVWKIGIVAIVAIAIIAIGVSAFGGRSYEETVEDHFNALTAGDGQAIIDLFPEETIDYVLDEAGYDDNELDEMIMDLSARLQEDWGEFDDRYGDAWDVTYTILNDVEMTGSDLDSLTTMYSQMDVKISAAREVEIETVVNANGEEVADLTMDIPLIKSGKNWYIDALNIPDEDVIEWNGYTSGALWGIAL